MAQILSPVDEGLEEMEVQLGETIPTSGTELEVSTDVDPDDELENSIDEPEPPEPKPTITFPPRLNDVKVENWGNFCLGKINLLYEKEEYCDLILRFTDGNIIKVHRIVLSVCTDYFANLEKIFGINDEGELVLPKDFEYNTVKTIIKFFYTGRMEVSQNVAEVYRAVRLMNITFLVKLLEAHGKTPSAQNKSDMNRTVVIKKKISPTHPMTRLNASNLSPGTIIQKRIALTKSLPAGAVKTKTVLARVQPQQMRMQGGQMTKSMMSPKKLPMWKDRKFTPVRTEPSPVLPPIKEEPARPTRFEWPDPEEDASNIYQTPVNNYFDKSKFSNQTPSVDFEALKAQAHAVKRSLNAVLTVPEDGNEPPLKVTKLVSNDNDSQLLNQDLESEISEIDGSGTTDDVSSGQVQVYPKTRITVTKSPNLHGIIKTPVSTATTPKVGKSVRFADTPQSSTSPVTHVLESTPGSSNTITVSGDNDGTHSKIIAELLKKFPDLVKDSKNIKLKIVPKSDSSTKEVKSGKVSYIVLKSSSSTDPTSGFVLKKGTGGAVKSKFWETDEDLKKPSAAVENINGPWICETCEPPPEFDTYYSFRKHLVNIHGERIDARICEHCGYKAAKRNLLLYHLYTKHLIMPPSHISFPQCESCDHIALSEPLLAKHRCTHDSLKEFVCPVCSACFKTTGALQGHMAANLHRNPETKSYECPYCKKHFIRNINLKAHIRTLHKDIARIEEMEDHEEYESKTNDMSKTEDYVPSSSTVLHGIPNNDEEHHQQIGILNSDGTVEIVQHCEQLGVPMSILQSSEAEALNNVASSIATSLSLQQVQHVEQEYVEGDGSSEAVYLVDNTQAVNLSELNMGGDNTVLLTAAGEDGCDQGQLIVQDIHGNRFQQVTGTDENGKSVIFFQLQSQGHHPIEAEVNSDGVSTQEVSVLGDTETNFHYETTEEGRASFTAQNDHMYLDPQKCSVFVNSGGAVPVESNTVIMTGGSEGTHIINMIPVTSAEQITHHLPQTILESEDQSQDETELKHEENPELANEEAQLNDNSQTNGSQEATEVMSDCSHNSLGSELTHEGIGGSTHLVQEQSNGESTQLLQDQSNEEDTQLLHEESSAEVGDTLIVSEASEKNTELVSDEKHQSIELISDDKQQPIELIFNEEDEPNELNPNVRELGNDDVAGTVDPENESLPQASGESIPDEIHHQDNKQELTHNETQVEESMEVVESETPESSQISTNTSVDSANPEADTQVLDNTGEDPISMDTDKSPDDNRLLVVETEESNMEEN